MKIDLASVALGAAIVLVLTQTGGNYIVSYRWRGPDGYFKSPSFDTRREAKIWQAAHGSAALSYTLETIRETMG